ncbi:hypothetical protein C8R45DRAFT_1078727 [Mycena sanguinolenta]|nr:hypothetical protein C8R45DRAFT_1078727 [Mycena sanguinolenta]
MSTREIANQIPESPMDARAYHEPRAHLEGPALPKDFSLPALPTVRADAVRSREMSKQPEDYENAFLMFSAGSPANQERRSMHLQLALIFHNKLPNLFCFSYAAQPCDVPEDIVDDCICALSMFICIVEECSEPVLRALGHVTENDGYKISKYLRFCNNLIPSIRRNRGEEAVPIAKAWVDEECSQREESWLENPTPFEMYGQALVLTRTNDNEAVKTLRRAMLGVESPSWPTDAVGILVNTRVWLARALRNIGLDNEAEPHEKWLVRWFRKHPHYIPESELRRILLPTGPVLEALGGEKWLDNRKHTSKTEQRIAKACRTCRAREPLITLSRCNNCKFVYYCSKDCQKSNWKYHKTVWNHDLAGLNFRVECREIATNQKQIEHLSLTDPDGARRATDWSLWRNQTEFGPMVHSLGLHHDPARGRTHIVVKQVEYVPTASKLKNKFRVVSCGVFRIKDVLRDMEFIMGMGSVKVQEGIDRMLVGRQEQRLKVPFIELTFGDGLASFLGGGATNIDTILGLAYDPDWRKQLNRKSALLQGLEFYFTNGITGFGVAVLWLCSANSSLLIPLTSQNFENAFRDKLFRMDDPRAYNKPRIFLDTFSVPDDLSLPALPPVRANAVHSREIRNRPESVAFTVDIDDMFPPGSAANKDFKTLPIGLQQTLKLSRKLSHLFCFSYLAHVRDVPDDIIDDCIWVLPLFIQIVQECSEIILRAIGYVQRDNDYELLKYCVLLNARRKTIQHLIHRDRATEAIPFAKAMVDEECLRGDDRWLQTHIPFFHYGEVLVQTRSNDDEAVTMLRLALTGIESGNQGATGIHWFSSKATVFH